MSVYERRYEVHAGMASHYTDDPAEALRFLDRGSPDDKYPPWCHEGYADYEDVYPGSSKYRGIEGTIVTRRTLGPVLRSTLEFRAQRRAAQRLLADLRGAP